MADTYELVRKMMGRLARAMGGHLDGGLRAKAVELAAAKPDIDWADPAVRKAHLAELVELAATLLGTAADKELAGDAEVAEAAELLSQVVLQDVEGTPWMAPLSAKGWPPTGWCRNGHPDAPRS